MASHSLQFEEKNKSFNSEVQTFIFGQIEIYFIWDRAGY